MKFKALPVEDFESITLDLEQIGVHGIFDDTALGGVLSGKLPKPTFNGLTALKSLGFTFGAFTTGTGTINVTGTGDWTVGTLAAGKGTITFPTRATTPTVLVTITTDGTYNGYAELVNVNASTALVWSLNAQAAPPALVNAIVFFVVVGL